jgi:hypothetical protein
MFRQKSINRAFIVMISANTATALTFIGMHIAFHNALLLMMGLIFVAATALMVAFMFFLRWRFKDL